MTERVKGRLRCIRFGQYWDTLGRPGVILHAFLDGEPYSHAVVKTRGWELSRSDSRTLRRALLSYAVHS